MKLDEDKIYIKIIELEEIYNFVIDEILNSDCLGAQIYKLIS
jgi:hypothetical protein